MIVAQPEVIIGERCNLNCNRRHFLAGSLAAGAVSGPLAAQDAPPVGTGMIGTGNRGGYLLKAVLGQPAAKVVAVCDTKPDRLDKAASAAARDKPATFSDYHRLLERMDVQAVFIATPCDLHVEMAIAALKAGKHVYCEKPLGVTPESIRELLKVARQSHTVFQAGQQRRYEQRLQKTVARIHEGIAGKVLMVKAWRHNDNDLAHDGSSADWFFNAKRSGDLIVENAVHNLDICNWVIGARPDKAAGFGKTMLWVNDPPGRTNMDGYTLSYEYANGVDLSFTQVSFHPDKLPLPYSQTFVYGSEGSVHLETATFYPMKRGASPEVIVPPMKEDPDAAIAVFFDNVRTGKTPFTDVKVGALAAMTSILGREAIYRKKMLTWQELGVEL